MEELLDKRMGARETLHGVVVKIEQAQGDVEVSLHFSDHFSFFSDLIVERLMTFLALHSFLTHRS